MNTEQHIYTTNISSGKIICDPIKTTLVPHNSLYVTSSVILWLALHPYDACYITIIMFCHICICIWKLCHSGELSQWCVSKRMQL